MAGNQTARRLAFIAIALVAAASLYFGLLFEMFRSIFEIIALLVVTVASVTAYTLVTFRVHTRNSLLSKKSNIADSLDLHDIEQFFRSDGNGLLNVEQAMSFIDAIVYPRKVFERISEQAEPFHRSLLIKSTYTVRLPNLPAPESIDDSDRSNSVAHDFVVPLFLFVKGPLQDGLRVYTGESTRVSTISSRDVLCYSAAIIRALFRAAGETLYKRYLGTLEKEVLDAIGANGPLDDMALEALENRISQLGPPTLDEDSLNTAIALISQLCRHHPVCVPIPLTKVSKRNWPSTFRFRLEYRIIPPLRSLGGDQWWTKLADWMRLALGVRLNRLFIPIPNAGRTRSYHLQVAGPTGTYLARQGTEPPVEQLDIRAQTQPRRGQRRAHLYVQWLDHPSEVVFSTQFFERAPGSFASTAAAGWAAAIVVGMLALQQIHSIQVGQLPVMSTLLPALLAVPIAVATWTRGEVARTHMHPSLLSRLLTIGTITVSLAAFAAAVVPREFWSASATVWILLSTFALALALVGTFSWFLRIAIENRLAKHGDEVA